MHSTILYQPPSKPLSSVNTPNGSGSSKNGDDMEEIGNGSSNSDSDNAGNGAIRDQNPGYSRENPIILDMDGCIPDSPGQPVRLDQEHPHSWRELRAPSPEDRTPTASPAKGPQSLEPSSRKRSPPSDDDTRPTSPSKRPHRNIARTCRAGDTNRAVERDDEDAPGYACPRQRLNWTVKDLESVHLAKDGSIQCTVIWEPTVVAKTDLVGAALHNRCEELFKETYDQGEWEKWLATHSESTRRGRKMGTK